MSHVPGGLVYKRLNNVWRPGSVLKPFMVDWNFTSFPPNPSLVEELFVPAHNAGDIIVSIAYALHNGGVPGLPTGFTNFLSFPDSVYGTNLGFRVSYCFDIGNVVNKIIAPGCKYQGCYVFRNVSSLGSYNTVNTDVYHPAPSLNKFVQIPNLPVFSADSLVLSSVATNQDTAFTLPSVLDYLTSSNIGLGGGIAYVYNSANPLMSFPGDVIEITAPNYGALAMALSLELLK